VKKSWQFQLLYTVSQLAAGESTFLAAAAPNNLFAKKLRATMDC